MQKIKQLWNSLPDSFRRVIHTAWQVGGATLLAHLVLARSSKDVQASFIIAGTAVLAVIKAAVVA